VGAIHRAAVERGVGELVRERGTGLECQHVQKAVAEISVGRTQSVNVEGEDVVAPGAHIRFLIE
jgi:hypothetical protein